MFDKKIKVWVNRTPVTLTNEEVKDLLLERADANALQSDKIELEQRLALANAKLRDYGHPGEF